MNETEIYRRINYHPPTEPAKFLHDSVRRGVGDLMALFVDRLPEGRENSLALTKLEEAMFWANAAIARNHDKLLSQG